MVRILIVTPWFPTADAPHSGTFVAREAAALADEHEVRVLHLDWTGSADDEIPRGANHEISRVLLRRTSPGAYRRAREIVTAASADTDIVHTHALTLLLPWLRTRVTDLPWVHSEHWSGLTSPETLGRAERAALRVLRPALDRPDVVIAESSRLAAAVAASRTGPIELVPCIVPEHAVVDPPRATALRLIGIGGLIPRKGPLLAVQALGELTRRGHDAELVWLGDGPLRDDVRREASRLGVDDRVDLAGAVPPSTVADRIDAANMLLLPTQGDNFCVVAAEALSHGRPIVSGYRTGAVDYADPSVSRMVEEQSGTAYADAVIDLWQSAGERSAAEVAATVAGRFTPRTVRTRLEQIYRSAGAV